jgi:hypothetical protein
MKCPTQPVFRYTWPGKNEAHACFFHAVGLKRVAAMLGFHLQFIPLSLEERLLHSCSSEVANVTTTSR